KIKLSVVALVRNTTKNFGISNLGAYLRKIAVDRVIIFKNHVETENITVELNKSGNKINQSEE
ncbi:hypothetical protein K6794_001256, partial [Listeria innocua]|nr:hypothetical protein [Listeria innocua]